MKLNSSGPPIYFPENTQSSVLRLGLHSLAMEDWIHTEDDLDIFHQHKVSLRKVHDRKCFQALEESQAAQEEFYDFLLQHLVSGKNTNYKLEGNTLSNTKFNLSWNLQNKNLWLASLWLADDICLMENSPNGYLLTAASVCSPTNWDLEEKIGSSMGAIHKPVPRYADVVGARVNRLLDGLKAEKPVMRFNWSIQHGNELFWRDDLNTPPSSAGRYWRIERQTLLRLPHTNAVVFCIRIFLHSFESMEKNADFTDSIKQLLQQLPTDEKRYKDLNDAYS
ncbi:MAG: hypothetical protein COA96_12115 [SAR86 cluster bacterium]|uniref:DUF3445 domain-containing protein n=1 Tax=SAR86 cluster bacterium TaxID=2030880 RepID=A0A2A5AWZ8_9GAMM|nr:MAG: hypothetical protein COA96_12115 [SAR86 cluster bacterium]